MKNKKLKMILSIFTLTSIFTFTVVSCSDKSDNKVVTESGSGGRKPESNLGNKKTETDETSEGVSSLYEDGEIIEMVDGSILKFSANGDHEILEQGTGKIIIFKTVTEEQLNELEGNQRMLVERQMEAEPLGFALVY